MEANARHHGVIKRSQVRVDGTAPHARHAGEPAREPANGASPRVRLTRLDENTQVLELTCACGEVSLIEIRTETKP